MRRLRPSWLSTLLLAAICGCRETPADAPEADATQATGQVRIISLSPAISRTLVDLDLADRIVGRTPFCSSLDESIPAVGDQQQRDFERMIRLQPTHVLAQPPSAGVDPELLRMARRHGWELGLWILDDIADVRGMLSELPDLLCGEGSPDCDGVRETAAEIDRRLAGSLAPQGPGSWRGRVLLVCFVDPVVAFGQETYLEDLLAAQGCSNALPERGWVTLSLEDVVRLDPEAVVVVKETPPESPDPASFAGPLASLDIEAAREGRIAVLVHRDVLLPSTALAEVAETLRDVLDSFAGDEP